MFSSERRGGKGDEKMYSKLGTSCSVRKCTWKKGEGIRKLYLQVKGVKGVKEIEWGEKEFIRRIVPKSLMTLNSLASERSEGNWVWEENWEKMYPRLDDLLKLLAGVVQWLKLKLSNVKHYFEQVIRKGQEWHDLLVFHHTLPRFALPFVLAWATFRSRAHSGWKWNKAHPMQLTLKQGPK